MTTTVANAELAVPTGYWTRERKAGAAMVALGLIASIWFTAASPSDPATFFVGETTQSGTQFGINGKLGSLIFGLIALAAGGTLLLLGKRFGLLVSISLAAFLLSALVWQVSTVHGSVPLGSLSSITMEASLPLIFGALAGVLCERSGVVNVAIEGQLLTGAFFAALFGSIAGTFWAGLGAAAIGGALISVILAWLAIRFLVDQVVIGIVLNTFALGLTGFFYEQVMRSDTEAYNNPGGLPRWEIPALAKIPILGPAIFKGTILTYLALALVVVITIALFRTRWGLRTRAVGEHPAAADTVGIRVLGLRYVNVLIAGLVAGLGGAYFSMVTATSFTKNITGGLGFIALAAMIFGRWNPVGAFLAAIFFGFAKALSSLLQALQSPIPSEFLAMLPYIATIFAVAGLVGRVRAPAADGKPYVKG
ncbi:MAG TPA: ABC transporter permease [Micromonosporaceae bacterium]|nr:ABC transporter permease [Micromonosporaceae bacterium]